jgi:hypothetical protein
VILKNRDHTPPGGFRFVHPETGYESKAIDIYSWMENIAAHRKANNLPPIFEETAVEQLCKTIPPNWCEHEGAGRKWVNTRLRWGDIVSGAKAYASFILSGFKSVSQDEANRRGRICSGCYLRVSPQGCGSCVKIAQLITGDIAGKKTDFDQNLINMACGVCACPVASLVWFPMPILEKPEVDSPEKQEAYPRFCWRKKI